MAGQINKKKIKPKTIKKCSLRYNQEIYITFLSPTLLKNFSPLVEPRFCFEKKKRPVFVRFIHVNNTECIIIQGRCYELICGNCPFCFPQRGSQMINTVKPAPAPLLPSSLKLMATVPEDPLEG